MIIDGSHNQLMLVPVSPQKDLLPNNAIRPVAPVNRTESISINKKKTATPDAYWDKGLLVDFYT